jgi:ubiquinone/menaquinone biosynthesis C-methylase UbiE
VAEPVAPPLREETDRVRDIWQRFAPRYDRQIRFFERFLFEGGRDWVCSRARGAVLEIGVGTGRNLPFYPAEVRVTGVDLSPETLLFARRRADRLGRSVDLRVGDAQALDFQTGSVDTVVSTLTMCSIPDHHRALSEAARVLRPGGQLIMLEHVRSPAPAVRLGQRLLNPLSVRFVADHLLREPLHPVRALGFEVVELERLKWGIVERLLAVKPETGKGS